MNEVNNDILKNSNYVSKSKIDVNMFGKKKLPKGINKKFIQNCFDNLQGKLVKTGNPFNTSQQRLTKVVSKKDLYYEVFKEYRSISKR